MPTTGWWRDRHRPDSVHNHPQARLAGLLGLGIDAQPMCGRLDMMPPADVVRVTPDGDGLEAPPTPGIASPISFVDPDCAWFGLDRGDPRQPEICEVGNRAPEARHRPPLFPHSRWSTRATVSRVSEGFGAAWTRGRDWGSGPSEFIQISNDSEQMVPATDVRPWALSPSPFPRAGIEAGSHQRPQRRPW